MQRLLFPLILLCAFLLRVIWLDRYPVGFTPDEASWGYDAYSLLKTGKDQWGENWPLVFKSFGDYKLPMYGYLTIPAVALFGLDEFAVRLPNALVGTLAVAATYLMVQELFKDRKLALISALFLSVSPWHLPLSRGAFEANLTTLLIPLGVWSFYKGIEQKNWMFISSIAFGANLFSYHSARLITPLIILFLLFINRNQLSLKKYLPQSLTFFVIALIAAFTMFTGAGKRGSDVAIFNPTDNWLSLSERRYEAVLQGVPDNIERVFTNKLTYTLDILVTNYFSYLSPQFLFTSGAGEWTYGMIPGRGVLFLFEILLFLAIKKFIWTKKISPPLAFLLFWILISPIPAALTKGPGYAANRVAVMMPAIQVLSAYGAITLYQWTRKTKLSKLALPALSLMFLLSVISFAHDYVFHSPANAAPSMLYGRRQAVEFAKNYEGQYDNIIISRSLSEPHIYVAFYNAWDPTEYQKHTSDWSKFEDEGRSFVDQLGRYNLGKYTFADINYASRVNTNNLLIGKPNEFPDKANIVNQINYPGGKPAIKIVDPRQSQHASSN